MKPNQINSRKRYSDGLTSGCKLLKKRGNDFYSGRGVRRGKHFESKEANDGQKKIYGNKTYSPFPTLNQTLEHYLALIRRLHCMLGERVSPELCFGISICRLIFEPESLASNQIYI